MSELTRLVRDNLFYQMDVARELILCSIAVILIAVLLNQRGWKAELKKLRPSSLRVNLITYLVDAAVLAVPLSLMVGGMYRLLAANKLQLFSHEMDALPGWAIGLACVAAHDLVGYWRHRLEHSSLLWPAHSLHHSDEEMTWFTLFRFHPLNRVSTAVIDLGALFIVGFPLWAIALSGSVKHFYGMFVHINRPWTLGKFGWLLVSPSMHRWHHVRSGQGIHSNYSTIFSVFDRMFGTLYIPGPCYERLGVEGIEHTKYWFQLWLPFGRLWRAICGIASSSKS